MSESKTYQFTDGRLYDAFQWTGEEPSKPAWAKPFEVSLREAGSRTLEVGPYQVNPGSWVLRDQQNGEIFPVPGDMFHLAYTRKVETAVSSSEGVGS